MLSFLLLCFDHNIFHTTTTSFNHSICLNEKHKMQINYILQKCAPTDIIAKKWEANGVGGNESEIVDVVELISGAGELY